MQNLTHIVGRQNSELTPHRIAPEKLARTVADTAEYIGCGRTTVYALIGEGKLEAVKLGTRTLILEASIRNLMAALPRIAA